LEKTSQSRPGPGLDLGAMFSAKVLKAVEHVPSPLASGPQQHHTPEHLHRNSPPNMLITTTSTRNRERQNVKYASPSRGIYVTVTTCTQQRTEQGVTDYAHGIAYGRPYGSYAKPGPRAPTAYRRQHRRHDYPIFSPSTY